MSYGHDNEGGVYTGTSFSDKTSYGFQLDSVGHLNVEVIRPKTTETTALGAAFFAGLASGYWPSLESLSDLWKIDAKFTPLETEETQKIITHWKERISKVSNSKVDE